MLLECLTDADFRRESLSGSCDEQTDGRDSWITGPATIKSPVLDSNPSAGEIGLASSIARYPSLTITSHRATFPSPSLAEASMHVACSPSINDGFDEGKRQDTCYLR